MNSNPDDPFNPPAENVADPRHNQSYKHLHLFVTRDRPYITEYISLARPVGILHPCMESIPERRHRKLEKVQRRAKNYSGSQRF